MNNRAYTSEDQSQGFDLIQAALAVPPWPTIFPDGWSEQRFLDEFLPLQGLEEGLFLVSEVEGVVRGTIAGHPLARLFIDEAPHLEGRFDQVSSTFYQRDIILDPSIRGGRVAYCLVDELEHFAIAHGFDRLVTRTHPLNERGIRFFQHLGYRELFRDDCPERIYYVLDLSSPGPHFSH